MGNATKALNAVKALKPKAKKSLASVAGSIKPKNIDVRIMASRQGHQVNDVVTLPSDEADAACEAGWASKRAADVKYAASLPQNKI